MLSFVQAVLWLYDSSEVNYVIVLSVVINMMITTTFFLRSLEMSYLAITLGFGLVQFFRSICTYLILDVDSPTMLWVDLFYHACILYKMDKSSVLSVFLNWACKINKEFQLHLEKNERTEISFQWMMQSELGWRLTISFGWIWNKCVEFRRKNYEIKREGFFSVIH